MTTAPSTLHSLTLRGAPLPSTLPEVPALCTHHAATYPGTLIRRLHELHDVFRPRAVARGFPHEFVLEVTSRCNLYCPMCPREVSTTVGNRDMDMDTFHRVLERIREVASFIWMAGLGEPMMNPHFFTMIREVKRFGIAVGASTNGTFLTEKQGLRLLDSGLDLLIVSFDGADKETYEKVRIGADFDKVCANVRRFAAQKSARRAARPWLILQMIDLKPTHGQAARFRRLWSIPGVDAIRIKKDELQFAEDLAFDGQRKRTGDRPCPYLWRGSPLIQWDGAFSPCCYGIADKSFGNQAQQSVTELWNTLRLQRLREVHLAGEGSSDLFCRSCNAFQPRKVPMALSVLVPSLMQKKHAGIVESLNRWVRFMD